MKKFLISILVLAALPTLAQTRGTRTPTNLILQSEDFTTTWAFNGAGNTRTANVATAPSGAVTADKIVWGATPNTFMYQNLTVASGAQVVGQTYTFSVWAWTDGGATSQIQLARDRSVDWVGCTASSTLTLTSTPTRYSLTYVVVSGSSSDLVIGGNSCSVGFTPAVGSVVYLWGAQVETGSQAGAYVATGAATVTGTVANKTAFFPLNKSGANLCTEFSGELTGNYWCGDTPTSNASGLSVSSATCTNATGPFYRTGKDKGPVTIQRCTSAGTGQILSSAVTGPTGSVSACAFFASDDTAVSVVLGKSTSGGLAASAAVIMEINPSSPSLRFYVSDGTTQAGQSCSTVMIAKAWHFWCGTYEYIGANSGTLTVYQDGAACGSSAVSVGPLITTSSKWSAAGYPNGASIPTGINLHSFFITEKVLSATTITQMSRAVFGSRGFTNLPVAASDTPTYATAMVTSRASAARFVVGAATGDKVVAVGSANGATTGTAARVTPDGLVQESGKTNLALQSEDFTTTWAPAQQVVAAPVITANSTDVTDPFGGNTADKIVYPAVLNVGESSTVFQTLTLTATRLHSAGVWVRTLSETVPIWCYFYQGGSVFKAQLSANATWQRCKVENANVTASGSYNVAIGADNGGGAFNLTTTGGTIYAWGYQIEQFSTSLGGYTPTTTTSAARANEFVLDQTAYAFGPNASMSASFTFNQTAITGTTTGILRWGRSSPSDRLDLFVDTSNQVNCQLVAGGSSKTAAKSAAISAGTSHHVSCSWDGTNEQICLDGTCTTQAVTGTITSTASTILYIGSLSGSNQLDGTIQGVCIGPASGDCK